MSKEKTFGHNFQLEVICQSGQRSCSQKIWGPKTPCARKKILGWKKISGGENVLGQHHNFGIGIKIWVRGQIKSNANKIYHFGVGGGGIVGVRQANNRRTLVGSKLRVKPILTIILS